MDSNKTSRFDALEKKVVGTISILAFCIASAIVIIEVIGRYVFGHSFMGSNETVVYLMATAAFLYFGITDKESGHLSVSLFLNAIKKEKTKKIINIVAIAISIAYLSLCSFLTIKLVKLFYANNVRSLNAELPFWIFYGFLLIGFILLLLNMFKRLLVTLKR